MKKFTFPLVLGIGVIILSACTQSSGALTVIGAWARPTSAGNNAAAYFVIENGTGVDDTLLSVSSEIASATEVHMSMGDSNGVMSMQMQESVPVPAQDRLEFKSGGLHVMLIGLNRDLNAGDTFILNLKFEKAGEIPLTVEVKEQ